MSRLHVHDLESAPVDALPHLERYIKTSPTGKILNLHGAMAHAPIVLEMYARMRNTIEDFGEFDGRTQWAAMLAVATVDRSAYSATLYAALGRHHGLTDEEIRDISEGVRTGDDALDAIVAVAHDAAASCGHVTLQTWNAALAAGWSEKQLGQLFAYLGLALFIDYFVNYSEVDNDLRRPVEA
jgi:alkylhydroperoxidase/carboxymuconolactone decarboxylase family protein YurZ